MGNDYATHTIADDGIGLRKTYFGVYEVTNGGTDFSFGFKNYMDSVRIYDQGLTDSHITAIYNFEKDLTPP